MKSLRLLTLGAVTVLATTFVHAQTPAPAAPGTPTQPAAPAPGGAPATPAATTPPAGAPTKKPFNSVDAKIVTQASEALQFHILMGDRARMKGKDKDKDLEAIGIRIAKESKDYYTPLVDIARAHGFPDKDIATEMSKADKSEVDKLSKAKEDKWKLEYYELFAKQAKKNARFFEGAGRNAADGDLKDLMAKAARIFEGHAESLEKAYKDLKNPKKDEKKK